MMLTMRQEIRVLALQKALEYYDHNAPVKDVLEVANKFEDYIGGEQGKVTQVFTRQ